MDKSKGWTYPQTPKPCMGWQRREKNEPSSFFFCQWSLWISPKDGLTHKLQSPARDGSGGKKRTEFVFFLPVEFMDKSEGWTYPQTPKPCMRWQRREKTNRVRFFLPVEFMDKSKGWTYPQTPQTKHRF